MVEIDNLTRLIDGAHRNISLLTNTIVVDNIKLKLGNSDSLTFSGLLTDDRTVYFPDSDVNVGHIISLTTLTGVAGGSTNLGLFTGSIIGNNRTIKVALQELESYIEANPPSVTFLDNEFRILDDVDSTKQIAFQASSILANTTRTISMPNSDVDLGLINDHETRLVSAETSIIGHENRISDIENLLSFKKQTMFISNMIYENGAKGSADQSADFRDGWYFKNDSINQFINWIFFSDPTSTNELSTLSAYAVLSFDSIVSTPYFAVYTKPTGVGDVDPLFHSKAVYSINSFPTITSDKFLVYIGTQPTVHPELEKIEISLDLVLSQGDLDPAEEIIKVSLESDVDPTDGSLEFIVDKLGINLSINKVDFSLRVKELSFRQKFEILLPSDLIYVDLDKLVIPNSVTISLDRLLLHEDDDYSLSTVDNGSGPVTRITWLGGIAAGGTSEMQIGDNIQVIYRYNA